MNIRKTTSLIQDQTGKKEFNYFESLKAKAKELLNCVEATPEHRSLLIMKNNGDTYTYSWNGCKQLFDCEYIHKNRLQHNNFKKYDAIEFIAIDIYNQANWKLI